MRTVARGLLLAALAVASCASDLFAGTVTCSSVENKRAFCKADTRRGVVLVEQLSRAGCWEGDTWGYDRRGIWVANGCRAQFKVGRSGHDWQNSMYHNGGATAPVDWKDQQAVERWGHEESLRKARNGNVDIFAVDHDNETGGAGSRTPAVVVCESISLGHTYCPVRSTRHVELKRQLSRASCQFNATWGYDRRGVWVSDGCRAEFWIN